GSARGQATRRARNGSSAEKSVGRTGAKVVRSSSRGGGRSRSQTLTSPGRQSGPGRGSGGGNQSGRHSSGQQLSESSERSSRRGRSEERRVGKEWGSRGGGWPAEE